ncbi:oxidoreductase, NAD-binding domain protein [Leptospira kirschneri str. 200801925]|nr:oxidoreductase, NAD-binding domain protein [Leptospira kirschneri str. 200801925]
MVADQDISKIQNFKMKWDLEPISFIGLDAFWASEINLDLLSICSNTASHFEILKKAMERNIPYILCEKPITDKEDELKEIAELSKKSNSKIIVNHILRWEPGVDSIKEN